MYPKDSRKYHFVSRKLCHSSSKRTKQKRVDFAHPKHVNLIPKSCIEAGQKGQRSLGKSSESVSSTQESNRNEKGKDKTGSMISLKQKPLLHREGLKVRLAEALKGLDVDGSYPTKRGQANLSL